MMGLSPDQFYRLTPWEYIACLEGWQAGHGGNKVAPPSEERFLAMMARADEGERVIN